jgi:hypothetical protein
MKVSELIDALKKYPPETQVMLLDKENDSYYEPELKTINVIAISEWGNEKICDASRKWEYEDCREFSILTIQ